MSYAQAAASGPKQSPEEHTDSSVHSLIDVDSPHISSVPSDFESQSVKTDTQAERIELEQRAEEATAEAKSVKEKAKAKAGRGGRYAKENARNPVLIGNAVAVGVLGTMLGLGAYKKWVREELSWKVFGAWAGVVGLFGVADYYVSQYLFQKYPPKK
ncbi:uncharacterized protein BDR25DRAFT_302481 [Lindgomyces ingoldianus]|uniref:Uncharacterized protein n=1 Tax=Lindgomyces ingoldianus TaxID=673940 RepID=A0ACB6R233_9PLEO|nr:uncharacterized protein BDR25DRAFT_302481 [Lindgomyces ingoldianus]KAF2472883.1 hypothetical protein BDR25DRAFT_302481 [Lindgomyces ingoldianus]